MRDSILLGRWELWPDSIQAKENVSISLDVVWIAKGSLENQANHEGQLIGIVDLGGCSTYGVTQ